MGGDGPIDAELDDTVTCCQSPTFHPVLVLCVTPSLHVFICADVQICGRLGAAGRVTGSRYVSRSTAFEHPVSCAAVEESWKNRERERERRMKTRTCWLPLAAQVLRGTSPAQGFTLSPACNRSSGVVTPADTLLRASPCDDDGWSIGRRRAVASAASLLALHALSVQPAFALKERNEALCSTGFFTNVGAWYCTDIGNIGDEGKSKDLSPEAESAVDSLMSKFDDSGASDASSPSKPSDPISEIKEQDKR